MKKRKLKNWVKILFVIILLIILILLTLLIFNKPSNNKNSELESLNYNDKSIIEINKLDIKNKILSNDYNKLIDLSLQKDLFNIDYIDDYFLIKYKNIDDVIIDINKLLELNYSGSEIDYILNKLSKSDIEKLYKYEYISDLKSYLDYKYFNINNFDRYIEYKKKNDFDYNKIIMNVNMNLDYEFYTNLTTVTNFNYDTMLVNKYNKLPDDYEPNNLVKLSSKYSAVGAKMQDIAASAFEVMASDVEATGMFIDGVSGYRSKMYQESLYNNYVRHSGIDAANTFSAKKRHSEHETGLAIDIRSKSTLYTKFETTKEYIWIKQNAHKYGFIVRYPKDKEYITGYKFEAWHLRYVGIDVATSMFEQDLVLEEYLILNQKQEN